MAQDPGSKDRNLPLLPAPKSQLAVNDYVRKKSQEMTNAFTLRERFEAIDRVYAREIDWTKEHTRARQANRYGDADRVQNIAVPVVMPQVQSAVTYQASVFLTGMPIFGVATAPEFVDAGMQLEAIIEQEQTRAGWVRQLMLFLVDGFKYNFSAVEVDWKTRTMASLGTNLLRGQNAEVTQKEWAGNFITRLNPYNTFHDPNVASADVPRQAEYAGYTELMSRVRFAEFVRDLPYKMNITEAYNSPLQNSYYGDESSDFYQPRINPYSHADKAFIQSSTDWESWMGLAGTKSKFDYKSYYLVKVMYARMIPREFGIVTPETGTPQIFKLITVNNSVLIYIERMSNAHNMLPILFGVPKDDGMAFEDKSLAENAEPFQSVATALTNSLMESRRRAIGDRIAYDPSRVSKQHIDNPKVARIPVRPSAYGTNIGEAFYQFPFRDDQAGTVMQEVQQILALGNEVNGQNKARQGQFVKGNKTQREFDTVMANANGRDQTTAILLENQVFLPMKEIIKTNILQYHGPDVIFSRSKNQQIKIDPARMREVIMEFKISDGLTPTDKLMDADSFTVAMQSIASSPQIGSGYNIAPLFSYLMKQRGADLSPFEKSPEQLAYEQALQAWQGAIVEAIKAGASVQQLPPQPLPEQYGYQPQGTQAAPQPAQRQTQNVNNITNNITNNR